MIWRKIFLEIRCRYFFMSLEARKPKRIIIFLGAGASAPFDYPTTKSFLERLGRTISGREKEYLNSIRNLEWVKDVEQVVEILDSLLDLEGYTEEIGLTSFFKEYPRFLQFARMKPHSPAVSGTVVWDDLIPLFERMRDTVEEFTFEQYESKVAQYARIEREYGRLFSVLRAYKKNRQTFDIFTTNYDNVIEDYCTRVGASCKLSVLNKNKILGGKQAEEYILTKLHGSLDWLIDKESGEITVTNTQVRVRKGSERWDKNEYVLFGRKVRLGKAGIYDELFERLKSLLLETDVCVVIGFSFRDKHVSEKFEYALRENKSLRLLMVSRSPKSSAKTLIPKRSRLDKLMKERRIVPLRCLFGKSKAIKKINDALSF